MEVANITSQPIPAISPKPNVPLTGMPQPVNDTGNISSVSRSLNESNIDLSNSSFFLEEDKIIFKLKSLHNSEGKSEIDGHFSESTFSGSFNLKYEFSRKVQINGKNVVKNYEADFSLSFQNHSSFSVSKSENKEDVLDFPHRIISGLFNKLNDPKAIMTDIKLNPQDLADLAQVSDKRLVQLVYRIMEVVKWAMKTKNTTLHHKGTEEVVHHPQMDRTVTKTTESRNKSSFDYSLKIRETGSGETSH